MTSRLDALLLMRRRRREARRQFRAIERAMGLPRCSPLWLILPAWLRRVLS